MEASEAVAPDNALAIAITKRPLYAEEPPLVGVGLVYKLHYIPTVPFSAAYMHLNVWHSAASNEESENQLEEPHLLFMNISEMSNVIPVAERHPVLLDLTSKEVMGGTGEPVSPLSFRGFRLHMTWTQHPGGELTHHFPFLHLLGEGNSSLINYELEKFPQDLMQGQKIAIDLKPPHQRPLEHHFGPGPPLDVGGLPAVMRGQASSPSSRRKVEEGEGVSNRGTYSWGAS